MSNKKRIAIIVGARPNFIKAFPVYEALKNDFDLTVIHTGQHFDEQMSDIFFNQLNFPKPDIHFELLTKSKAGKYNSKLYNKNSRSSVEIEKLVVELLNESAKNLGQIGEIRERLMNAISLIQPNLVMVFGDVTSTLASALAAKKSGVLLAHVEAGLRSNDYRMPEEVNRILTDTISDYLFVSELSGVDNLKNEGLDNGNVFLVGNTMIDTQQKYLDKAMGLKYYEKLGLEKMAYVLITVHRPENVDAVNNLRQILDEMVELSAKHTIVFPIHHRTLKKIIQIGYLEKLEDCDNIKLTNALGYLEFTSLLANASFLVTDSGGLQEESTALNIPCFTLRHNTERPSTLIENQGTNQLINSLKDIHLKECKSSMQLWDGKAGSRIKEVLLEKLS